MRTLAAALILYAVAGYVVLRIGPSPDTVDGSVFLLAGGPDHAPDIRLTPASLPEVRPPAPASDPVSRTLPSPTVRPVVVRGALSVHTGRSHDAEGTLDEVAAAARRADLDFVVLGDHPGDWMQSEPSALAPRAGDGVLLVPGVELVVAHTGRTLAVGLDTAVALWEGGVPALTARADSLGGFLSVVHPRSPRARERWEGLEAGSIHAWESLDISEMARTAAGDVWLPHRVVSFLGGMAVGRGEGALARMWQDGTRTPALLSYDSVRATRPVALTGGLNHHPKARLGSMLFPRYEPFFRTVVNHVTVEGGLEGDPSEARQGLLAALRAGRLFVTLRDAPEAAGFDVHGESVDGDLVPMGGRALWRPGTHLHVRLPDAGPERMLVRLIRNGGRDLWLDVASRGELAIPVEAPGIYRVEVFQPGLRLGPWRFDLRPWILSNPVEFYGAD